MNFTIISSEHDTTEGESKFLADLAEQRNDHLQEVDILLKRSEELQLRAQSQSAKIRTNPDEEDKSLLDLVEKHIDSSVSSNLKSLSRTENATDLNHL